MGLRTTCEGSAAECTGPECQWDLWKTLNRVPMEAQREEKQFLTQVLLTWVLDTPKQGRHVEV